MTLWTDFDEILCVDSCGGLHDLVRFWARSGSESGYCIRILKNCKTDSANSNGQISMKSYGRIVCESRKTAFNFGSDRDWGWLGASGGSPHHITTCCLQISTQMNGLKIYLVSQISLDLLVTSDKGGSRCFCTCSFVCLSVCLLATLLKNACIDLDEILLVDRCRDMDELINFWARSGL